MKKLFLVLALLILGSFMSQGAFAVTFSSQGASNTAAANGAYPSCYKGYGVGDPLYNGTNGDRWAVRGWCVDQYGVLTPQKGLASDSSHYNTYGGYAVPVTTYNVGVTNLVNGAPTPAATYDVLIAQQTGSRIVDYGGYPATATADSLGGIGQHHMLPPAMPGEEFTIASATKSTITVDVLNPSFATTEGLTYTNADTIEWSPGGTAMTAGQNIHSPGFAGDSVTLYCVVQGQWMIQSMQGAVQFNATSDSLWTVQSAQ